MELVLQIASAVTPILIGFITLVIILSKMHYSVEVLKEKVKILFDFHNKHKK